MHRVGNTRIKVRWYGNDEIIKIALRSAYKKEVVFENQLTLDIEIMKELYFRMDTFCFVLLW